MRPARPPGPLSAAQKSSIYSVPRAARNTAVLAAAFTGSPRQEQTRRDLEARFPEMSSSTVRGYLGRWTACGWLRTRPVRNDKPGGRKPFLAYSLTPDGAGGLGQYLRYYAGALEELNEALLPAARQLRGQPPADIPLLQPAEAAVLLYFHRAGKPGKPRFLSQVRGGLQPASGLSPEAVRNIADRLASRNLLSRELLHETRPGWPPDRYALTEFGHRAFPGSAALLRRQIAAAYREIDHGLNTELEAAL